MTSSPRHAPGGDHCLDRPRLGPGACCLCGRETRVVALGGTEHDVALLLCGLCLRWLLDLVGEASPSGAA